MRIYSVEVDANLVRATIILRPSRLARFFGATDTLCELGRSRVTEGHREGVVSFTAWISVNSGRNIEYLKHGDLLQRALEHRPIATADLPVAQVVKRPAV